MRSIPAGSRKSIGILLGIALLLCVGLIANHPFVTTTFAQDEPTVRPFPTAIPKTVTLESTTSASSEATTVQATVASGGEPTVRPFPTAIPKTVTLESTTGPSSGATVASGSSGATAVATAATATPTLTIDNAMSTIAAIQSENKDLQDKLASAQTDKGATLYAIVIVVIGLVLAFAVFFGLSRSGK